MKNIFILCVLFSSLCFAGNNSIVIDNMNCISCVKQVTSAICQDAAMSEWFATCSAEIMDRKKAVGRLIYSLKQKNLNLDTDQKKKIEAALAAIDRKVLEYK